MIKFTPTDAGIVVAIHALPGSRRNGIRGERQGALKVSVTQVAERGKANEAIRTLLAKAFGLRISQVELVRGATSATKSYLLRDLTAPAFERRVSELI